MFVRLYQNFTQNLQAKMGDYNIKQCKWLNLTKILSKWVIQLAPNQHQLLKLSNVVSGTVMHPDWNIFEPRCFVNYDISVVWVLEDESELIELCGGSDSSIGWVVVDDFVTFECSNGNVWSESFDDSVCLGRVQNIRSGIYWESIKEPWHLWGHLYIKFEYTNTEFSICRGRQRCQGSLVDPDYMIFR